MFIEEMNPGATDILGWDGRQLNTCDDANEWRGCLQLMLGSDAIEMQQICSH